MLTTSILHLPQLKDAGNNDSLPRCRHPSTRKHRLSELLPRARVQQAALRSSPLFGQTLPQGDSSPASVRPSHELGDSRTAHADVPAPVRARLRTEPAFLPRSALDHNSAAGKAGQANRKQAGSLHCSLRLNQAGLSHGRSRTTTH